MLDSRSHTILPLHRGPHQAVELHVHLDGAVRCSTLYDIAIQRNVHLPPDVHSPEDLLKYTTCGRGCTSLDEFLQTFLFFAPILADSALVAERIAYEFADDQAAQGILYTEVRYSPHLLAGPHTSVHQVIEAVTRGLQKGCEQHGIIIKQLLCMMRHEPAWSEEVVQLAYKYRDLGVVGVDIAGSEVLPIDGHVTAFKKAKELGLHITVHAGEVNNPENVRHAIEVLGAERIGHGYAAIEDPSIIQLLKDKNIHLECCYSSSIDTGAVREYLTQLEEQQAHLVLNSHPRQRWHTHSSERKQGVDHVDQPSLTAVKWHPIQHFVDSKLNISLNTDDPGVSHINLLSEYSKVIHELGLTYLQVSKSIISAAKSCFLDDKEKQLLLQKLKD